MCCLIWIVVHLFAIVIAVLIGIESLLYYVTALYTINWFLLFVQFSDDIWQYHSEVAVIDCNNII